MASGVSWLHDSLVARVKQRADDLKERIAMGVPDAEYRQMVGRYRECKRLLNEVVPELFTDFYQADEGEDSE